MRRRVQDAVDLVLGSSVGRDRHRAEAGALGLRRSGLDLRPAGARRARLGRRLGAWRRQRAAAGGERAHLLLHAARAGRRVHGSASRCCRGDRRRRRRSRPRGRALPAAGRRSLGGGAARQRFERADHHLHVDQLLLELLDALAQGAIARRRGLAGRAGGSLRRCCGRSPSRIALRGLLLGQGERTHGRRQQGGGAQARPEAERERGHGVVLEVPCCRSTGPPREPAAVACSVLFNTTLERPQVASQLRRRGDRRATRSLRSAGRKRARWTRRCRRADRSR